MQAGRSAFLYPYRKDSVFPLLSGKGLGLPAFCRKAALKGLAGQEKSSSLRSGIFPARPCAKRQSKRPEAYKIGKTHPDGIIHS